MPTLFRAIFVAQASAGAENTSSHLRTRKTKDPESISSIEWLNFENGVSS